MHRRNVVPSNFNGTIGSNHFSNSSDGMQDLIELRQFCHTSLLVCVLVNMKQRLLIFDVTKV